VHVHDACAAPNAGADTAPNTGVGVVPNAGAGVAPNAGLQTQSIAESGDKSGDKLSCACDAFLLSVENLACRASNFATRAEGPSTWFEATEVGEIDLVGTNDGTDALNVGESDNFRSTRRLLFGEIDLVGTNDGTDTRNVGESENFRSTRRLLGKSLAAV
jgi:hypothetical protein